VIVVLALRICYEINFKAAIVVRRSGWSKSRNDRSPIKWGSTGVSRYIGYLLGFYVHMARAFLPSLKNSWKMALTKKGDWFPRMSLTYFGGWQGVDGRRLHRGCGVADRWPIPGLFLLA
jgi:hypothetical protein